MCCENVAFTQLTEEAVGWSVMSRVLELFPPHKKRESGSIRLSLSLPRVLSSMELICSLSCCQRFMNLRL